VLICVNSVHFRANIGFFRAQHQITAAAYLVRDYAGLR